LNLGKYYLKDYRNWLIHTHVDPETFGREIGVLAANETVEGAVMANPFDDMLSPPNSYPETRALLDEARSRPTAERIPRPEPFDAERERLDIEWNEARLPWLDCQLQLFKRIRGRAPANVEEMEAAVQTEPELRQLRATLAKKFGDKFGDVFLDNRKLLDDSDGQ
jgi:hypothetical protein